VGRFRATRVSIDLPVAIEIDAHVREFRATNISLGGMFLSAVTFPIDAPVSLTLLAPPHIPELQIDCTARWSTADGTGLRFDNLLPADIERLAQMIREVLAQLH
jgi:hypothetical protein